MGKGDKKSRKGKITVGSYGRLRPRRKKFRVRPKVVKDEVVTNNA
ncbi:30S ribosomal protein THX [Escherichia coli]